MFQLKNLSAFNPLETARVFIKSDAAFVDMNDSSLKQVRKYWEYLSIAFVSLVLTVYVIFVTSDNDAFWIRCQVLLFSMKHHVKMGESPVKQKSARGGMFVVQFAITAVTLTIAQYLEFWYAGYDIHTNQINKQSKEPPMAKLELQIRAGGITRDMCNNNTLALQMRHFFSSNSVAAPLAECSSDLCADALPCVQTPCLSYCDGVCSIRMCRKETSAYDTTLFRVKYKTFVTALEADVRVSSALPEQTNSIRVQFWPESKWDTTLTGNINASINFQPEQYVNNVNGTEAAGYRVAAYFESQQARASRRPRLSIDWPTFSVSFHHLPKVECITVDPTTTHLAFALKVFTSLTACYSGFGFVLKIGVFKRLSGRCREYFGPEQELEVDDDEYQLLEDNVGMTSNLLKDQTEVEHNLASENKGQDNTTLEMQPYEPPKVEDQSIGRSVTLSASCDAYW